MGRMVEKGIKVVKNIKTEEDFNTVIEEMEEQGFVLLFALGETLVFKHVGKEEIERLRKESYED